MAKEMIVSVNGREKKIAIIEDDVVTEFYVERGDENQGIVGNIYKGRVMKVLPGMQSAFVDIGLERDAFLYVSDFLEEEEFAEVFTEVSKEVERPAKAAAGRSISEPPLAEELVEEGEEEADLNLAALHHIEEIGEEPVIEPAPDDEVERAETAQQRRQRRLHYFEPEAEKEEMIGEEREAAASEVPVEEKIVEEAPKRRRRSRRKRDEELPELPEVKAEAEDKEAEPLASAPDYLVTVHHESLERVTDEDLEASNGAMLKDALVQEKITEQIHAEEYRVETLEVEPTPEVHVGSLRLALAEETGFERVSDESEEQSAATSPAEATVADEGLAEAASGPPLTRPAKEVVEDASPAGFSAVGAFEEAAAPVLPELSVPKENAAQTVSDSSELSPLEDASAQLRESPPRAEFATRRGGRGRRRGRKRALATSSELAASGAATEELEEGAPTSAAEPSARPNGRYHRPAISDLLREGQEILVQIAKEPIGQKGARITSHIALPGRYVVYMPNVEHIGVSRKIASEEERQRLKRALHQLRGEEAAPGGFIVRTAANGRTLEELREDVQYLLRTWTDIRRRAERVKAPAIVHRDLDLVQRILRDQLSSEFTAIRVDNEFEYERIVDFVNRFAPKLVRRVKLYTKETPILEEYGVQAEIDKAVKSRVWLKSGGYIVINQTEALVAIDVNTGKFVGRSNRLEDTIVKTNLEAAREIVRQIRLRDLGGIIVLDFIDMEERRNRQKVMQVLEQELRNDRSPSKILQFNDFGLVAITRKRVKQSLERTLCTTCSYCGGSGMVKSPQTVCYEILAESRRIAKDLDGHNEVILRVNPEVAKALRSSERDVFNDIEATLGSLVTIKSDPTVHQEQFDIALV
jgi:ribonuclease G